MIVSEDEYYVLSEMITMEDRMLAQKMELLLWTTSSRCDDKVMRKFTDLLNESETAIIFYEKLPTLVAEIAKEKCIDFGTIKSEDAYKCALPGKLKISIGQPTINARGQIIK